MYVRHTPEQQVCILNTTYKRQISADRIEFELFPRPCGLVVGVSVSCIHFAFDVTRHCRSGNRGRNRQTHLFCPSSFVLHILMFLNLSCFAASLDATHYFHIISVLTPGSAITILCVACEVTQTQRASWQTLVAWKRQRGHCGSCPQHCLTGNVPRPRHACAPALPMGCR